VRLDADGITHTLRAYRAAPLVVTYNRRRMSLVAGTRVGGYEVIALIGAGGMGEVYRARDTKLGRDVALKVLPETFAADAARRARMEREARTLATVNHPRIAAIYGWEDAGGRAALVMEFVDGVPLADLIGRGGMAVSTAAHIALDIAAGIEAAHRAGITHRDLKPSNVMVSSDREVKLLDFGLARNDTPESAVTNVDAAMTAPGVIVGTVLYMSPEQAQGLPVDARSDIFSFGVLMFEMLTGKVPFARANPAATMAAILHDEPDRPSAVRGEALPSDFERIVLKCLRKDPRRRFQTAADLRVALEDVRDELASGALPAVRRPASRPRMVSAILALAAIVALTAAAAMMWTRREEPTSGNPLRQQTFHPVALMPALSLDSKLLVYAADGGTGELDLWVKQVAGGDAVRITRGMGATSFPQFSSDGTRVYFLNHRNEILEVSTFGGVPRALIEAAGPFSVSTTNEIAFVRIGTGGQGDQINIFTPGGEVERWRPECEAITPPAWAPDAQQLAFVGRCHEQTGLLTAPRVGGEITRVPVAEPPAHARAKVDPSAVLLPSRLSGFVGWSSLGWVREADGRDSVVAAWRQGDTVNIHRIGLDGSNEPITLGTGWETFPSVTSNGTIAFVRAEITPTVWSLPADADTPIEEPRKAVAPANMFDVSDDGTRIVYGRIIGSDLGELRVLDTTSGQETRISSHTVANWGLGSMWPALSPDNRQVVYRLNSPAPEFFVASLAGGTPRLLAAGRTLTAANEWYRSGSNVIGECSPTADGLCTLDVETQTVLPTLKDPSGGELLSPSWSWDGHWVTFMRRRAGATRVWVAPVRDGKPDGNDGSWVAVSPTTANSSRSRFHPAGDALYYLLNEAGTVLLVRQALDPLSKRPVGELIRLAVVQAFPTGVQYSVGASPVLVDISRDRVYFSTVDLRSTIWLTSIQ
jgi:predicted Ser/Thr protein kinase